MMNIPLAKIIVSLFALSVAIAVAAIISLFSARLGSEPLIVRALITSLALISFLIAVYPFNPLFTGKPGTYAAAVCLPVFILVLIYYLYFLPTQAGEGMSAEQLQSQLITDSSSNGIIEVGFGNPIYTPTITISNHELFTRQVNVFLRMIDSNGETALFRAVRALIPGSSLSLEASVQGMLSETDGYEFNPIVLPPNKSVTGKVVFVISNLDDGASFTEALGRAYQAQFELRDPESGELVLEFPLTRI